MTTEDKEQGYFEQAQEAFAKKNAEDINAGTSYTDVSVKPDDPNMKEELERYGNAATAAGAAEASASVNNTTGGANSISDNNMVAAGAAKVADELTSYERKFDIDGDGELDPNEKDAKEEQERAEAEATRKALQAALGAVLGAAGAVAVVSAVNSFDEQDKALLNNVIDNVSHQGPMQCANCKDANSLPTFAQTPTVPGISQQQYLS